jgi:aminopeptidase N
MKTFIFLLLTMIFLTVSNFSQTPPIENGVSHELAIWRAKHYSDVRYKLNLTLEKMSPILKGTIEVSVRVSDGETTRESVASSQSPIVASSIILDWRKMQGKADAYLIKNVELNGKVAEFEEINEHLVIKNAVQGENVVKLQFTSPISTSGSAITRYVDKEDGSEYIYSLFVPSDASTAFPVFDQPDLKARFQLEINTPIRWFVVSNSRDYARNQIVNPAVPSSDWRVITSFEETKPISSYVFAFAAGNFDIVEQRSRKEIIDEILKEKGGLIELDYNYPKFVTEQEIRARNSHIYVRKSQAEKFKQHSAEVFRLNRECIKYLEGYFDYKFPFPKYDLVLIPEFPFGGMEHAGATFLRESSIIFPSEPTKNDIISRANLIFHEAAHQWFGDTVTMKWFDDLWLKEGFAEFMAYKTLEKVIPEANAWKAFYERNKQLAYLTDSTKGTTPIYQEIANLSSAKSAYGNIVYRKAPSFLRQAEFYLGEKEFQIAVRKFLKKNEFKNAEWTDLVKEFETGSGGNSNAARKLDSWSKAWVKRPGLTFVRAFTGGDSPGFLAESGSLTETQFVQYQTSQSIQTADPAMPFAISFKLLTIFENGSKEIRKTKIPASTSYVTEHLHAKSKVKFAFPNYQDYGYGIFLLDEKSRNYILANVQNEKDDFLRSMMYGSLWDSVREAELDPKDFVELAIKNLGTEKDEMIVSAILSRVNTAFAYYLDDKTRNELSPKLEEVLINKMQTAETQSQKITFYRAFLNVASSDKARNILKGLLNKSVASVSADASTRKITHSLTQTLPTLRTKDKFDIVTKLLILNDKDAENLLAELIKTETSDDAKRYAYAARAGIGTTENKAKYFPDFVANKEISESWIESAFVPFNSTKHSDLTIQYLEKALSELPNLKRNRKIFFVNGWLSAFIGGQKSEQALAIVNKFLADNPNLDKDLRLKILENVDVIERAVKIRQKFTK